MMFDKSKSRDERIADLERYVETLYHVMSYGEQHKVIERVLADNDFIAKIVDRINSLQLKKE